MFKFNRLNRYFTKIDVLLVKFPSKTNFENIGDHSYAGHKIIYISETVFCIRMHETSVVVEGHSCEFDPQPRPTNQWQTKCRIILVVADSVALGIVSLFSIFVGILPQPVPVPRQLVVKQV